MFTAKITVTLRPAILDVQGKAVEHALHSLGSTTIEHVRIGKFVTLNIDSNDPAAAKRIAEEACSKLIANPIIEDYAIELSRM